MCFDAHCCVSLFGTPEALHSKSFAFEPGEVFYTFEAGAETCFNECNHSVLYFLFCGGPYKSSACVPSLLSQPKVCK